MKALAPLSPAEVADVIRGSVRSDLGPDAAPDGGDGTGFTFAAPATGQRFRVEVSEIVTEVTP